jgi:hypothetical protein
MGCVCVCSAYAFHSAFTLHSLSLSLSLSAHCSVPALEHTDEYDLELQKCFESINKDGDGQISRAEFVRWFFFVHTAAKHSPDAACGGVGDAKDVGGDDEEKGSHELENKSSVEMTPAKSAGVAKLRRASKRLSRMQEYNTQRERLRSRTPSNAHHEAQIDIAHEKRDSELLEQDAGPVGARRRSAFE